MTASRGTALLILSLLALIFWGNTVTAAGPQASTKKVLVVMSYHESSNSGQKIRDGINSTLTRMTINYFYLDTKNHPENGKVKAAEAYEIYKTLQPDLVIAADDNAQSLFVLPYLKGKVKTPVVFCGVNDDAKKYGYPTGQITGIIEKKHYKEGITFARLIKPDLDTIGVIYKDTTSNRANISQVKRESLGYPVKIVDYKPVKTTMDLRAAVSSLEKKVDGFLVLNLAAITDEDGRKLTGNQGAALMSRLTDKPTIGTSKREIVSGILCGVAKLNIEQGLVAARMAREILAGKAVRDIPVTWNRNGQRVINVSTARRLAISLKPVALIGTDLVQ